MRKSKILYSALVFGLLAISENPVLAGHPVNLPAHYATSIGPFPHKRPSRYHLEVCDHGDRSVVSYIRFDLSAFTDPEEVTSAHLILHPDHVQREGWLTIRTAADAWDPVTINHHNKPDGADLIMTFPVFGYDSGNHIAITSTAHRRGIHLQHAAGRQRHYPR